MPGLIRVMQVAVIGSGGLGGYFGALLARGGADVSFIARGAHLEAMRERGFGSMAVLSRSCSRTFARQMIRASSGRSIW